MTVSCHSNGSVSIQLIPETAIEKAYVDAMLEAAIKGRTVTLSEAPDGGMIVTVPK